LSGRRRRNTVSGLSFRANHTLLNLSSMEEKSWPH
jgi:hypothetical protein